MAATALAIDRITINDHIIHEAREAPLSRTSTLVLRSADGQDTPLPEELQQVLLRALASIAESGEVTIGRMPPELTSTVAADLLGVSRPTLMKWAHDGTIDSFKVGSHTRFRRDDVLHLRTVRAQQRAAAHNALRAFDEEHESLFDD
ncbi:helix-turn-helix domain-containing protein [Brachybacterium sp. EF45031]|uniref:helix-turn-helix domain-containing protein n=1 Tax=Brachybacterium sillae TaxID=2810536 RepID=UPI00217DF628|nr:helix-turn-helix domain-containing protein [Brachybacterium sillae]MCS6711979.1 helix-turn-helix domain-containing protein [Brachybacterium sillae]